MELYLMRHGIAEMAKPGMPDANRALTADGRRKLREVLRVAKSGGVRPELIITSPYRRALETAEVAAAVLGYKKQLLTSRALEPGSSPMEAWDEVRLYKDEAAVMLVGHEPLFSQLAAFLLDSPSLAVDFKKGALLRVDIDQFGPRPQGVLRFYLPPKLATPPA